MVGAVLHRIGRAGRGGEHRPGAKRPQRYPLAPATRMALAPSYWSADGRHLPAEVGDRTAPYDAAKVEAALQEWRRHNPPTVRESGLVRFCPRCSREEGLRHRDWCAWDGTVGGLPADSVARGTRGGAR